MKKFIFTAATLMALSHVYADEASAEQTPPPPTHEDLVLAFSQEVRDVEEWTAHDRIILKQRAYFPLSPITVSGSLLYFRAFEDGLDYVTSIQGPDSSGNYREKMGEPHFRWNLGFKLDLTYRFLDHDSFDLSACWTSFRDVAKDSSTAKSNKFLVPSWGGAFFGVTDGLTAANASSHLALHVNILDVDLAKRYFITKYVVFRPHIGLRSAWIDQDYRANYSVFLTASGVTPASTAPAELDIDQDFFGIGLRSGAGLNWFFSRDWSATGRFAASILSGYFDVDQHYKTQVPTAFLLSPAKADVSNDFHRIQGVLEGAVGVQWGTDFSRGKYRLSIGAEYEVAEWFRHNYFIRSLMNEATNQGTGVITTIEVVNKKERGEMGYQGLNLNFQLDF